MDYKKFRLRSLIKLQSQYILRCGSFFELPTKYCNANPTDMDLIIYSYDICAIPWNRNPPKNTKCTVLRIDSKKTPPGFARLIVDRDNTGDNTTYFRRPPELSDITTGGPSWPCEHRFTNEGREFLEVNQNEIPKDLVPAVYCPYWPVEAEEWRNRRRINGWPNEKLIARITRGGCHFVSKLRTWSSCDDTEWRFSFSKAELLLIHSWTPDQKLAYHVIRIAKKTISEYCGGNGNKGLQTYYFKTLMLWACEEFPPEFWNEQNMNTYVETLFCRFYRCLDEKFCPSYFIPECNIMSHLEDEVNFEKELQTLQIFSRKTFSIIAELSQSRMSFFKLPLEYECLTSTCSSFPLNKEFNGRCALYLSECEWFLPEMKNLHAAVEAHLRLMTVDSVTQRQASKDYIVCAENFNCALVNSAEFQLYEHWNGDQSFLENLIRIFVRKLFRNSVTVYRRMSYEHCAFHRMTKESLPFFLHGVTSAYWANFYFTAMQSCNECLSECEKFFEVLHEKAKVQFVHDCPCELCLSIPLLICNGLSRIFDEHLQVILGFATLHRNISFFNSSIIATSHEVCFKLKAWEFLKYIYTQCEHKLYSISEPTDYPSSISSDLYRPFFTLVVDEVEFSTAIFFAALRQSRAYYKN